MTLRENAAARNVDASHSAATVNLLKRRIDVAQGREPGDLLLTGGRVANVFTQQVEEANVVIADGWIAGVGPYDWRSEETIDLEGRVILPGLIDAHIHIESTLLMPAQLAWLIVPCGTTTLVADPHEVGNVLGTRGIEMLLDASEDLPLDCFFMAPSCVPCTSWEHAGAVIDTKSIEDLLDHSRVIGLAEVMDFPAVLDAQRAILEKIETAQRRGAAVDGHAPGLMGQALVAYSAAGIRSDHESTTIEEALAKASLGMMVQVREGSSARNLDTLMPLLVEDRLGDWCLATDDIHPDDLRRRGHLDHMLRRVVAAGVPAVRAVRHATLVPAQHYGLGDRGAVAPAQLADLLVVDDLVDFHAHVVIKSGKIVVRNGQYLDTKTPPAVPKENTVHIGPMDESAFRLPLDHDECVVIGIVPDQIVTQVQRQTVAREDGHWAHDPARDIALVASIERHRATGNVGLGLVRGLGLSRPGALGCSVAHDSHNLIVAGTNARDMLACVRALEEMGGGFVAAADAVVTAKLPLPVAGLLSTADAAEVCRGLQEVRAAAAALGSTLHAPFGTLSFLALSVIPDLRITDQGLFDVGNQEFVTI